MEDDRTQPSEPEQAIEDLEVEEGAAEQVTGGRAIRSSDPCEGGE
jgi:hypothetical protein